MFIHSAGVAISTRICDLEARLPGAKAGATHHGGQEETCGRECNCNRKTWNVVCQRGRCLKFLNVQPSLGGTGMYTGG